MGTALARALVLGCLAAAGCYSPSPVAGLPCSDGDPRCPAGQFCDENNTCQLEGAAADASADEPDAPPGTPDGAPPADAPPGTPDASMAGLVNDHPAGAIDVGGGGTFVFDTSDGATDDTPAGCSGPGGLDVFYKITLTDEEVIYADTFGTDFDPVLLIYRGDCTPLGLEEDCLDDPCGGLQSQGAWNLPAGTYCIIVDQGSSAETGTHGELRVARTGRKGVGLPDMTGPATVAGDTCGQGDDNTATCGCAPSPDIHYFFTVCAGAQTQVDAFVCNDSNYDAVMELRDMDDNVIDCNDDSACGDSSIGGTAIGPGLFWIIMDGCTGCGTYTMTYDY